MGNKLRCKVCDDIIVSNHVHDFVRCKCGAIFVDGGDEYLRLGCDKPENVLNEDGTPFFKEKDGPT